MPDSNNTPPPPSDAIVHAARLDVLASQIADQADPEGLGEDAPQTPEVVFIESAEETAPARTPADTDVNLDHLSRLAGVAESAEAGDMASYLELEEPGESGTCFGVDPFSMTVDGEVPAMPSLPVIDAMTREVLSRQSNESHSAWRLMPLEPRQGSAEAKQGSSGPEEEGDLELANGNKDCFYAKPGDVVFVDGNLGFDHIDLSVYEIDHATFQPDAILLFVNVDAITLIDPDVSPQPITIRHRGVSWAIFKGGVVVDL